MGGDGSNANCGPTSTLMAMQNEGLVIPSIPGIEHNGTDGADVQAVRYWGNHESVPDSGGVMTTDANEKVSSTNSENAQYTGFPDVKNAVTAAGGTCEDVAADSGSIRKAIEVDGMSVVISGTFVEPATEAPRAPRWAGRPRQRPLPGERHAGRPRQGQAGQPHLPAHQE